MRQAQEILAALPELMEPGTLAEVVMLHDDDCPGLTRGAGACTCEPAYRIEGVSPDGTRFRYRVNEDGTLEGQA